jgi:hypothetical protein
MLRNRVVGASIVLALAAGIAAGVVLSRPGPSRVALAEPAATQEPAAPAAASTPPPMPDGVVHPAAVTAVSGGGHTVPCATGMGPQWWDPPRGWPTTPSQLYRESDVVVLATLTETHGYWVRNTGQPPSNWTGFDWAPLTATDFHVDHVYKGSAGPWLQVVDTGANRDNIPSCQQRVPQRMNWPLPATTHQQYILFLPNGHEAEGPADRWPVIDGVVHPDHDIQPDAWQLGAICYCRNPAPVGAMPLDQFVAAMQGT